MIEDQTIRDPLNFGVYRILPDEQRAHRLVVETVVGNADLSKLRLYVQPMEIGPMCMFSTDPQIRSTYLCYWDLERAHTSPDRTDLRGLRTFQATLGVTTDLRWRDSQSLYLAREEMNLIGISLWRSYWNIQTMQWEHRRN